MEFYKIDFKKNTQKTVLLIFVSILFSCNNDKNSNFTFSTWTGASNDFDTNDTTTVGKPVMDVNVKISKEGEILVKGPNVMLGYWNDETLTKKTIKNNWLHTGDLGSIDILDRLKIVGRKKDLIVTSGGDNVSPTKIENILTSYSKISQAVIYGDNKPYLIAIIVGEQKVRQAQIKKIINILQKFQVTSH